METIKKEYLQTNKENNFIKIELYYYIGGYNVFTHKEENRGYYISVSPVEKRGYMESYTAFTGIKNCIVPCSRKSKKQENIAIDLFDTEKQYLINYVLQNNDLQLI